MAVRPTGCAWMGELHEVFGTFENASWFALSLRQCDARSENQGAIGWVKIWSVLGSGKHTTICPCFQEGGITPENPGGNSSCEMLALWSPRVSALCSYMSPCRCISVPGFQATTDVPTDVNHPQRNWPVNTGIVFLTCTKLLFPQN